jgi:hypothetical protein
MRNPAMGDGGAREADRDQSTAPTSLPPAAITCPAEAVLVVHVTCGMVTWRRVYITAEAALSYADRMQRRGHEAEVRAAILVGGAW